MYTHDLFNDQLKWRKGGTLWQLNFSICIRIYVFGRLRLVDSIFQNQRYLTRRVICRCRRWRLTFLSIQAKEWYIPLQNLSSKTYPITKCFDFDEVGPNKKKKKGRKLISKYIFEMWLSPTLHLNERTDKVCGTNYPNPLTYQRTLRPPAATAAHRRSAEFSYQTTLSDERFGSRAHFPSHQ